MLDPLNHGFARCATATPTCPRVNQIGPSLITRAAPLGMAVAHATPSLRTANQSGPFTFLILTATPTPKQTDRKVKSPQNSDNLNNKEIVPNSY